MVRNISTLIINAPAVKVWDALTRPELVKQWQFGSDLVTGWKPGSSIRFSTAWEGQLFEQWGTVLEMQVHALIRYNLFAPRPDLEDKPENYFIMNYILTPENGHTRLEIIREDGRSGAKQEEPQGEENPVLKLLKEIAESL
ncbi:MAG: SRPBCC family protein [Bacteroidota bacterium]